MKKPVLVLVMIVAVVMTTYAGGLLTNTNQSAQFVRMLSRNASTQIDAVYFNPAGLTNLKDGLHFALMNQSIWQTKTVNSGYPFLNDGKYVGEVEAPLFPNVYAVWKKDKLAFSLGVGPNAGGGSATFHKGLPSFEIPFSKLPAKLSGLSQLSGSAKALISGYNADLYFDGSSVFWGIQLGATLKVNDVFSGYLGVRYMPSKNTYSGYIHNIQLKVNGTLTPAAAWMTGTEIPAINGIKAQLDGAATSAQQLITAGAGSYTLAQVQGAGYISSAQRAALEAGLAGLGLNSTQIAALNITQVKGYFSGASTTLGGVATSLAGTASQLGNKDVKTEQTGAGWTPIVGANINVGEKLNIGVKYEFKTKLELTNKTSVDDLGLFPDGGKSPSDIPAILAVGIGYKPVKLIEAQLSYNLYFDKGVNWGTNVRDGAIRSSITDATLKNAYVVRTREIDKNYWELALGLQFNLTDNIAFSLGGLRSKPGVADSYQSDFSYTNPSTTLGGGFQFKFGEKFIVDAGVMNTWYQDATVSYTDPELGAMNQSAAFPETFSKKTWGFGLGLTYSIF